MQTFIPVTTSFDDIAKVLDRQRLNKQALEGWQIMMTLLELDPAGNHRQPKGWRNHPAVKMWRGYEFALYNYIQAMVREWKRRGYNSTIGDKASETLLHAKNLHRINGQAQLPPWMLDSEFHESVASSHRTALLSKDYGWYSQFDWPEDTGSRPETYEYIWPLEIEHAA